MPELPEAAAAYYHARRWLNSATCSFTLSNMYVDATETEARRPAHPLAKRGLPYPLSPGSKVKRGPKLAQNLLYPPFSCTMADAHLKLVDVHFHARNLILQFKSDAEDDSVHGEWWMQVQLLTHTVVQIYEASDWHDRVSQVDKKVRGFRVGVALDFGEYVMAFLTLDNLFRVWYARTRDQLDAPLHDIYFDFEKTLNEIIAWAELRVGMDRTGLAIHVIWKANKTFLGVGVYTIIELFHRAGLLPFLTEEEVFDNPARLARFVEAYFSHASRIHQEMDAFIQPFLHGKFYLAVHNTDWLEYQKWLAVYAKDRVQVSSRWRHQHKRLREWLLASEASKSIIPRSPAEGFFDLLEPMLLQAGLSKDKNLGSHIFGFTAWQAMGGKVWLNDPITCYFKRRGIAESSTFLHPSICAPQPLFLDVKESRKAWVNLYLYFTEDKPFWCTFYNLPANSCPYSLFALQEQPNIFLATSAERCNHLFENLVQFSRDYVVGPLDFCGVARIHQNCVMLCRQDPAASDYLNITYEANHDRRRHLQWGKKKIANPNAKKRKRQLEKLVAEVENCVKSDQQPAKRC